MKITRVSPLTRKETTLDLDVTQEQLDAYYGPGRPFIQDVFPHLSPSDREFIKTGYTQSDWEEMFGRPDQWDNEEDSE
jgi:hypothetical protein